MTLAFVAVALAHMALEEPLPRYPTDGNGNNKACPCGVGESNRLCDVPSDRSDPDRSEYITTYAAGETVTLHWHETIGHAGRWRVAFDADGADMEDFNNTILLDIADPAGTAGNTGNGDEWKVEVTLPNVPCDNCTLQLVQIMDGDTANPVPDPVGRSSYYQCADIVLVGAPGDTSARDTGPVDDEPVDVADTKGCGCQAAGLPSGGGLALFVWGVALRRRRQ
jgi:uncharacterized protein (TIGR03382 family)